MTESAPTFAADDTEPGKNSWYTAKYSIKDVFNGGLHTMTLKLEGFNVPSSIATSSIAMEVIEPASPTGDFDTGPETNVVSQFNDNQESFTFNPASVAIDGKEITLTLPDVRPEAEITKKSFDAGSNFTVIIYQSAGVANPNKANTYGGTKKEAHPDRQIFVAFSTPGVDNIFLTKEDVATGIVVPRVVALSEDEGGLGDHVNCHGPGV